MPTKEEIIKTTEKEIENLEHELEVCKVAKRKSDICVSLRDYVNGKEEPFGSMYEQPNSWQKNTGGGGGCIIL